MSVKVLAIVFACVITLVRGDQSLLTPCRTDDVDCLSKSTGQFLSNTCKGIPEYDIQAIDPMTISSTDFEVPEAGLIYHFKDLTIKGLKDQKFSDFHMDPEKKDVMLTTNADLTVAGDITLEVTKKSKSFSGTFRLKGSVAGTATYGYSFRNDDKGQRYFVVGPEKITCQALGDPEVTLGPELEKALNADPEVKASRQQNKERMLKLRQESLCHIAAKAYITVVHNIRASANILPASNFLIDV